MVDLVLIRKIALILAVISLLSVIGLTATKFLNIQQIEETGTAESYHDMSAWIYTGIGLLMMLSGYITWMVTRHLSAFILPFGLGLTLTCYGLYILSVKGMIS